MGPEDFEIDDSVVPNEFEVEESHPEFEVEAGPATSTVSKPYVPPTYQAPLPAELVQSQGEPYYKAVPEARVGKTFGQGQYWNDVKNRTTKGAADFLGFNDTKEQMQGTISSPLTAGLKVMGAGLEGFQKHIGKHVSAGALNALFGKTAEDMDDPLVTAGVHAGPKRPPLLWDQRNKMGEKMLPSEVFVRIGLSMWAGNDFMANEEEALPAINEMNMNPYVLGGLMFAADQVGSLPLWLFNPGAKTAAAERQALMLEAKYASRTPGELVKDLARTEAKQGMKAGGVQGALQGAKDANRDGSDFDSNVVGGALIGGVLGRVMGYLGGRAGAKNQLLTERNKFLKGVDINLSPGYDKSGNITETGGVGLPQETWEAFVQEAEQLAEKEAINKLGVSEANHYDIDPKSKYTATEPGVASVGKTQAGNNKEGYYTAARQTPIRNPEVIRDWKPIDTGETPTYHTVERDQKGGLWEVGHLVNANTQNRRVVKQRKITAQDAQKWRAEGRMPSYIEPFGADNKAFAALTDWVFPEVVDGLHTPNTHEGTVTHSPPEQMKERLEFEKLRYEGINNLAELKARQNKRAEFLAQPKEVIAGADTPVFTPDNQKATPPKFEETVPLGSLGPTLNGNQRTRILTVDSNGGIHTVPIADNISARPDKSIVREGDVVTTPGGGAALVDKVNKSGTVDLVLENGTKAQANVHDVAPAIDAKHAKAMKNFYAPSASAEPVNRKDLLKLKKLTVARVAARMDMEPHEAAALLNEMQRAGKVTHDGEGNFYPRKWEPTYSTKAPPEAPGYLVYYDVNPVTGNGKEGILRGPDPKKKGNYLIEIGVEESLGPIVDIDSGARQGPVTQRQAVRGAAINVAPEQVYGKTKTISVSPDKMRSVKPQLWGNAKLSQLPEQYGFNKPVPPGTIVASTETQTQIAKYIKLAEDLNKKTLYQKISDAAKFKFLFNDAFLSEPEIRLKSQSLFAGPANLKARKESYTEYLTGGTHGVLSKHDSELQKILKLKEAGGQVVTKQQKEIANYFAQHPELDKEVGATFQASLERIKLAQEFLAKNGINSVEALEVQRAMGMVEEYETNLYLSKMMGREKYHDFARKNMPEEYERAIKYIMQQEPGKSWQDAQSRFLELLDVNENTKLTKEAAKIGASGDAKHNLRKRVEMGQAVTKILGKVESAGMGVAHALAVSESLVNRINTWNEITNTHYWSPGPRADLGKGGGVLVPNHPVFGKAAGGRVHESLAALTQTNQIRNDTDGLIRTIGQYWKFNVVPAGGIAPWVNNVMRNWKGMVLSGGIERPGDFATFFDAAEQMLNYKSNPIMWGPNQQFLEAMNNGAVSTGFAANEINQNKTVNRILDAVRKQKGKSRDMWEVMQSVAETMKGGAQNIGAAYDTIDRVFKFTAYLNLKRRFIADGLSPNDAAAMATMRINDSFPNYELVAPLIERMRNGTMASVAPFLTSKAEDMRVNAKLVGRLTSGKEPMLYGRLLAAASVLGGAYLLNREIGKVNGITDEEYKRKLDEIKLGRQAFSPGRFIGPTRDSEGRTQVWDTTTWDDTLMTLRIHPMDPMLAGIVRNTLVDIYGQENLPGQGIDLAFTKALNLHPLNQQFNDPKFNPGVNTPMSFLGYIAQHGGVPGFIPRLMSIAEKGKKAVNPRQAIQQEVWTDQQTTAKMLGAPLVGPVSETGGPSTVGRTMEFGTTVDTLGRQMDEDVLNNLDDPTEQKRLMDAKLEEMNRTINEYQNRGK